MKNHIKQLTLLILVGISLGSRAQITVDADLKDWGDSTKFKYDNENKLWYNFKKDGQFLYVAIKKKENASKALGGGVQISFSSKTIDSNAFQVTFADNLIDPVSTKILNNHDYFSVRNYNGIKSKLLAKYNETGMLIEWKYTNIDYTPRQNLVVRTNEIPANPNVFTAEIQLPLTYLQKNIGNIINFSICLRGVDVEKKGKQHFLNKRLFFGDSISELEMTERMYFTEFFSIVDLTKL